MPSSAIASRGSLQGTGMGPDETRLPPEPDHTDHGQGAGPRTPVRRKRRASIVGARKGSVSLSVLSGNSDITGPAAETGRFWGKNRDYTAAGIVGAPIPSERTGDVIDRLARHASKT